MPRLKRSLGFNEALFYGIGIILGAGIYAIIGEGAALSGNALWLAFIISAAVASFTGLSYAELASMFPKAAAEYVYSRKAFNRESLSFIISWLIVLAGIVSGATVALGFGGYFSYLFGTSPVLAALVLLAVLSLVNFIGMGTSAKFNVLATLIEMGGLVLIIAIGIPFMAQGNTDLLFSPGGTAGLLSAAALIFFAFIGFEDLANITEETKDPRKNIPRALLLSLAISTALYILVSISAVSIVGWEALASSDAPLTEVAVRAAGQPMSIIFSVIALFATGNTVLIMIIVVSRMLFGVSRGGSLPAVFSRVHPKTRTPHVAIACTMLLAMVGVSLGSLKLVASLADAGFFTIYLFTNLSLIALRMKGRRGSFRSPLNIGRFPVLAFLGAITCFGMLFLFDPTILAAEAAVLLAGYLIFTSYSRIRNPSILPRSLTTPKPKGMRGQPINISKDKR